MWGPSRSLASTAEAALVADGAYILLAHLVDLDLTYPEVDLPVDELRAQTAATVRTVTVRANRR